MISINDQNTGAADKLQNIDKLTAKFAGKYEFLASLVQELYAELNDTRSRYLRRVREAAGAARTARAELHAAVEAAPELFDKPRTRELHNIKVGFRKGSGGIDWDDDAKVCELIRRQFTKPQADLLIKTTEKPIAKALADLDGKMVKQLGCRVEATGDVVVINPVDSEVDKLVKALLATDEVEQAAKV